MSGEKKSRTGGTHAEKRAKGHRQKKFPSRSSKPRRGEDYYQVNPSKKGSRTVRRDLTEFRNKRSAQKNHKRTAQKKKA